MRQPSRSPKPKLKMPPLVIVNPKQAIPPTMGLQPQRSLGRPNIHRNPRTCAESPGGSSSRASTFVTPAKTPSRVSFMQSTVDRYCGLSFRTLSWDLDNYVTDPYGTRRRRTHTAKVDDMSRVLLIEDDQAVRTGLQLALTRQGHAVHAVETGELGLSWLSESDVVVLDLMLPGIDGFEVCRRIRATGDLPIIMLTARSDDMDVVAGLEAGADDYVVKPVQARVLEARIRAVLRRSAGPRGEQADLEHHGDLTIDRAGLVVSKSGAPISLAPTELRLLLELSGAPGRVLSRQHLLEAVWEHGYLGDSRLVDACVQRLRAKIEDDPAAPIYVQTVRGFGYRLGPL
jgi:DNA-binding response OmpR family regulator